MAFPQRKRSKTAKRRSKDKPEGSKSHNAPEGVPVPPGAYLVNHLFWILLLNSVPLVPKPANEPGPASGMTIDGLSSQPLILVIVLLETPINGKGKAPASGRASREVSELFLP